jgi:hypothetical protein
MQTKKLTDAIIKNDFSSFVQKCFATTNPNTKYLHNWHLDLIAQKLLACESGEIKRLIINIPPRYMKSLSVTVAWPAWLLGRNPARRIIAASYSQQLAIKHALDTRLIINAPWYKTLFPDVKISPDQNQKAKFITTKRGFRFATSVEGTLTGEGGNFLILDDPHNPVNIFSKKERENVINWYNQVFATRLDDKQNGVIVIVMQRLHPDDLCGFLHKSNSKNWHEVIIPAISADGKALHEARESYAYLQSLKAELGSYVFAAQYMQNPIPTEGGMIKPHWFKRYSSLPAHENIKQITQSWDTAIKSGANSDYSVCTTWAETVHGQHYLLDVLRVRAEYPELKRLIISHFQKYKPHAILIEDKASGQSLLQDLRKLEALSPRFHNGVLEAPQGRNEDGQKVSQSLPLIPILPKFDKITRMAKASTLIEAGRVLIPHHNNNQMCHPRESGDPVNQHISNHNWIPDQVRDEENTFTTNPKAKTNDHQPKTINQNWLPDFEAEVFSFPNTTHDDQCDSLSQYLNWAHERSFTQKERIRVL